MRNYFESIIARMPGHVFWLDRNNIFLGCNDLQARDAGLKTRKDIVGKTNYDMPWKKLADDLNALNNLVMQTGKNYIEEEPGLLADGRRRIYLSEKVPLRDEYGEIIGVLGIAIDITEKKKIEKNSKNPK